jgi:hypothetical protein
MPSISDTAYPRLKASPSQKDLEQLFTPSPEERLFAWEHTSEELQTVRLLTWLKVFQRLGYFPSTKEIPLRIIEHVAATVGVEHNPDTFAGCDSSRLKWPT